MIVGAALVYGLMPSGGALSAYEWEFSERSVRDAVPETRVTLIARSERYDVGAYQGTCSVEEGDYLPYEKSKVECWYAGAGKEIGVFEEPGQTVVRVGEIDEGASGMPGTRDNFKLIERIP